MYSLFCGFSLFSIIGWLVAPCLSQFQYLQYGPLLANGGDWRSKCVASSPLPNRMGKKMNAKIGGCMDASKQISNE
jgi:hypothetical protein